MQQMITNARLMSGMDITRFERWLRASGRRPDTITRALSTARSYLRFCSGQNPESRDCVISFMADATQRVRRITALNYHNDLRLLFACFSLGDVMRSVPKPRPSLYEKERDTRFLPYTEEEFKALLDACPTFWQGWLGLRDRAILHTLWETPIRSSELTRLLVTDIDWQSRVLTVRSGKGGVRYSARMPPNWLDDIEDYLCRRRFDAPVLFIDRHGGNMTGQALILLLRRVSERAGWTKPCTPHLFRHNWRLRARQRGMDDFAIAACMGHATVSVTHGYAREAARRDAWDQWERLSA